MQYRGFEIKKHTNGGYVIFKLGCCVCSQPSIEFARKWIDTQFD